MITFSSLDTLQINTSKNHVQRRTINLHRDGVVLSGSSRDLEATLLQSLRPNHKTISIPVEYLAAMLPPIEEDEVITGHHILAQRMRHDGMQAIELLPHVGRPSVNEDADRRR